MIYLDNAATSWPKPAPVQRAVYNALTKFGANPGRSGYSFSISTSQEVFRCRETAASFFNAKGPECVAFTLNCTLALNMAIKGLLNAGDHVITSNLEHNAVIRPLHTLSSKRIYYDIARVSLDGNHDATVASFESLINKNTKMIVCTHASNVWGLVLPIKQIGELAKKYGLYFVVDVAQSAGIVPIDMQEMKIDFLCGAGHKSLYGPMGTGFLISNNEHVMSTIIEGGTGSNSLSPLQPVNFPDRFESGTVNTSGILGLAAGFEYVKSKSVEKICHQGIKLMQHLYDELKEEKDIKLYIKRPDFDSFVPMISFNIEGMDSSEVSILLDRNGIAVRGGLHCSPLAHRALGTEQIGAVRVCPSTFTTRREIDHLIYSVKKIIRNKNRAK